MTAVYDKLFEKIEKYETKFAYKRMFGKVTIEQPSYQLVR